MTCENVHPDGRGEITDASAAAVGIIAAWAEGHPDICRTLWNGLPRPQQELTVRCQAKLGHKLAGGRMPTIRTGDMPIALSDVQCFGEAARLMLANGRGPLPADLKMSSIFLCRVLQTMVEAEPTISRSPAEFWRGFANTALTS